MSDHAFSSPSAASRTENCAASALRGSMVTRRTKFIQNYLGYSNPKLAAMFEENNQAADHGTFLHDQQEQLLKHGVPLDAIEDPFERDGIQRICDDILEEQQHAIGFGVEDRLFNDGVDSFGSSDAWALIDGGELLLTLDDGFEYTGKWLHNRDLKTGRVEVDAKDNSQGLRYSCGVMEKLGWPEDVHWIKITIDAFRFPSSSWIISRRKLLAYWVDTFRPAMLANNRLNPVATPGDHCHWCQAKVHCAEFIGHVSGDLPEEIFDNNFDPLDTAVLEDVYSKATQMKDIVGQLKAELILRNEAAEFTGQVGLNAYKIKAGNSVMFFKEGTGPDVEKALAKSGKLEVAQTRKLRSASAISKLIADDEQLAKDLEGYIVKSQNKPSLVRNT